MHAGPGWQDLSAQESDLATAREQLDARFQETFEKIAVICDENELAEQALFSRSWIHQRSPFRQYAYLPESEIPLPDSADSDFVDEWRDRFMRERFEYAAALFDLCKQVAEDGDAAEAYSMLYEVLVHDPDHTEARRILGYQDRGGKWTRTAREIRSYVAPKEFSLVQWPKRTYTIVESHHFTIYSTADEDAAIELAESLERWYWVWRQIFFEYWSSRDELKKWLAGDGKDTVGRRSTHKVILFRDRDEYLAKLGDVEGIELSTGYYNDRKKYSFFYDADPAPIDTWRHEIVHQLFQENGGAPIGANEGHIWLVEGIAMYFETMHEFGPRIELGGLDALRMQYARLRAKRENFYEPLENLVNVERGELQQHPKVRELYSQSAGICQFLMTYDDGRYRPETIQFLRKFYRIRSKPDPFDEVLGSPLDQIDRQYQQFLNVDKEAFFADSVTTDQIGLALGRCGLEDVDVQHLADRKALEWLELSDNPLGDEAMMTIAELPDVMQLYVDVTRLTDKGMQFIAKLSSLQELDIASTRVGSRGIDALRDHPNLRVLWMANTMIDDDCLDALQSIPNLQLIDIRQTKVSQDAVDRLKEALPELKVFQ